MERGTLWTSFRPSPGQCEATQEAMIGSPASVLGVPLPEPRPQFLAVFAAHVFASEAANDGPETSGPLEGSTSLGIFIPLSTSETVPGTRGVIPRGSIRSQGNDRQSVPDSNMAL